MTDRELFERGYYAALMDTLLSDNKKVFDYPEEQKFRDGYRAGLEKTYANSSLTDQVVEMFARENHYDFMDSLETGMTKDEGILQMKLEMDFDSARELLSELRESFEGELFKMEYIDALVQGIGQAMQTRTEAEYFVENMKNVLKGENLSEREKYERGAYSAMRLDFDKFWAKPEDVCDDKAYREGFFKEQERIKKDPSLTGRFLDICEIDKAFVPWMIEHRDDLDLPFYSDNPSEKEISMGIESLENRLIARPGDGKMILSLYLSFCDSERVPKVFELDNIFSLEKQFEKKDFERFNKRMMEDPEYAKARWERLSEMKKTLKTNPVSVLDKSDANAQAPKEKGRTRND